MKRLLQRSLVIVTLTLVVIGIQGCATDVMPEASKAIRLGSTAEATGCKFMMNRQLSSCRGFGAPSQLRNTKNMMINDVYERGANAYIINELSASAGRCGSADYDIYTCPKDYKLEKYTRTLGVVKMQNINSKTVPQKLIELKKMLKDGIITRKEYQEKRKKLLDNY